MGTKSFCLNPLDMLFFRDGRPFGAADRVQSGLPRPQTLAGALRTWMLRKAGFHDFTSIKGGDGFRDSLPDNLKPIADVKFRGPWLYRYGEPLIPVPPTLMQVEDSEKIVRVDPLKSISLPGWQSKDGMLPLWRKDNKPAKRMEGFLSLAGLKKYCEGGVPASADIFPASDLYEIDTRTGIGVDPDALSAEESKIYAVGMLALKKKVSLYQVSLYIEVEGLEDALEHLPGNGDAMPFGGEGRRVTVEPVNHVEWPSAKPSGDSQGAMLILTSPGLFGGALPKLSNGAKLLSAAVGGYEAVSGWDMARGGPKPNRFAVNAGSVYFVNKREKESVNSLCEGEDKMQGYGIYVQGRFDYV